MNQMSRFRGAGEKKENGMEGGELERREGEGE